MVAIITISSLAFLLFQVRRDMHRTIEEAEARLALQAAYLQTGLVKLGKDGVVLDAMDGGLGRQIASAIPALTGQVTVAVSRNVESSLSYAPLLAALDVSNPMVEDTQGRFVIKRLRLFASVRDQSTMVLTAAPLSALTTGLLGRIAPDLGLVFFLGFLMLLIRESRLSDHSVRRLLDASPVPLLLMDAGGSIEFANRTALDLFSCEGSATLDRLRSTLEEWTELSAWLLHPNESHEEIATKDFEVRSGNVTRYLLASRHSFVVRSKRMTVASIIDISVQHAAEVAQSRAKEAAESLGRAKSELLAMISHELKTPVNGVLGLAQLLAAQSPITPKVRQIVDRMIQAGQTLAVLVNDVVDLAMLETGHLRLDHQRFNPRDAVLAAVSLTSALPKQQSVSINVSFESALPLQLIGDAARLQQIMINLVGNSIKFTEVGSINVCVDVVSRGTSSVELVIKVIDTGIGISEELIPRLFQPFAQGEVGNQRRFEGTGLGLAISRRLATAMGGVISLESKVGFGSTFQITLPFDLGGTPATREAPPLPQPGLCVLVVDDVQINREVVAELLADDGCLVSTAASGPEAIQKCLDTEFDLVFMDVRMPGMDGLATTAAILANHCRDDRPIAILGLTANMLPADQPLFALRGFEGVVEKPVKREELRSALVRHARRTSPVPATVPPRFGRLSDDLGRERADRIIALYAETASQSVEEIANCYSHLDLDGVIEAAHRLAGAASNVGFDDLATAASQLETDARAGQSPAVTASALLVMHAFREASRAARQWERVVPSPQATKM
ncbi:signal transduction histidine kinase/CheY-like chemotaxis protein/HPt (histidine-containing phosphotransfer) domain-containing protein [Bradyrhizobium elkanii]|uniref:ATP-binding protein n=1 Tax=Bradyrhizobium TaxID=374 RepID=UPI0027120709|nr:ATP-binding protein [Bradyrhizobium elkanii]WLA38870.1 ATP-binding protein [Bradyrhizobium elkanii]